MKRPSSAIVEHGFVITGLGEVVVERKDVAAGWLGGAWLLRAGLRAGLRLRLRGWTAHNSLVRHVDKFCLWIGGRHIGLAIGRRKKKKRKK